MVGALIRGIAEMKFHDKLLSNQREYFRLYEGDWFMRDLDRVCSVPEPCELEYPPDMPAEAMSSHPATLRLIQILLKLHGAKSVLEIGTFVGRSAIWMSMAGRHVTTIEKGSDFAQIARRNVVGHDVRVILGDAMHYAPDREFDALFIDGDKEHYLDHFLAFSPLVRLVMVDDCFFHGDVLNAEPTTEKGRGVKRFLEHVAGLDGWLKLALPLGNGLFIMCRDAATT
jgi:predicted O-methyltransferase YrrM